ncbi:hypothetical protein MNBD_BACTEROID05-1141, partial [hydrothermal vent metagenome]
FVLDNHHLLEKEKPFLVCSNTASMLKDTRLAKHFQMDGDLSVHYGLFEGCGETPASKESKSSCC